MTTPPLQITVDTTANGQACYLPLAPTSAGHAPGAKIALRLSILNQGASTLQLQGIDLAFPGSATPPSSVDASQTIAAGATLEWFSPVAGVLYLDGPAPAQLQIGVRCAGFSNAKAVTLGLTPFPSPSGAARLHFPFAHADLQHGEAMSTKARHWIEGPHGTQLFAHDISCLGPDGNSWEEIKPGTDGMANSDFRIYGKPVRAIAAGTIAMATDWRDAMAANTLTKKNGDYQFPDNIGKDQAYGNFVIVTSGAYRVLYAHLQKDSILQALGSTPTGATIAAGQVLGLAGNTGYAQTPHTHMQCEQSPNRVPAGLPFCDIAVIDQGMVGATNPAGPWAVAEHQGIPGQSTLIMPYPAWSGWRADLGAGSCTSAPAALLDGDGHLHCFAQGLDGNIWHSLWNGSVWTGWRNNLGAGSVISAPAVALDEDGHPHVFARGQDRNIWHTHWNGAAWSGWHADLGAGTCQSAPVAARDASGRLHVFVQGDDGNIWHSFSNGSQWRGWKADLGAGTVTSQPAVTVAPDGTIHVFAQGTDRDIWHAHSVGDGWSGWRSDLGAGTVSSNPSAVAYPDGDLHVFARGEDRNIWHTFWNGSHWSGWRADLGAGTLASEPVALRDAKGWLHVFALGDDRNIWHSFWNGQAWSGWHADLGAGTLTSIPAALSYPAGDVHVFAQGSDHNIWHSFLHWKTRTAP